MIGRLIAALAVVVGACSFSKGDPSITVDAGYEKPDGSDTVPFQPPGVFQVNVTATVSDPNASLSVTNPLKATISINDMDVVPGAVTSATVTLSPQGDAPAKEALFAGAGQLAWPRGGDVPVLVQVSGALGPASVTVKLALPQLGFALASGSQSGSSVVVPMCVRSSLVAGQVSVHLEQAAFSSSGDTDKTFTLVPGDCDTTAYPMQLPAGALTETVQSHAPFTAMTSASAFTASALVSGAANAPPIATISPQTITPPTIESPTIQLSFTNPPATMPKGADVTLTVHAANINGGTPMDQAHVSISFQTSPAVVIVPASVTTNGSGDATAQFAMPDLGPANGLVITAVAGNATATTYITN